MCCTLHMNIGVLLKMDWVSTKVITLIDKYRFVKWQQGILNSTFRHLKCWMKLKKFLYLHPYLDLDGCDKVALGELHYFSV